MNHRKGLAQSTSLYRVFTRVLPSSDRGVGSFEDMKGNHAARGGIASEILSSWRRQPGSMIVLRAFLGITFVYAGIQKLADPGYLHPGSPTYFATQVSGFAQGSPIAFLLDHLAEHAMAFGTGVAVAEILIGLGTLTGYWARAAAAAGFVVNLALWLSATWHVHPYFIGADSIYAVAWAAYGLHLWSSVREDAVEPGAVGVDPSRRTLLKAALLGGGALLLSGVARVAAALGGPPASVASGGTSASGRTPPPSGAAQARSRHHRSGAKGRGTEIASLDSVQVGAPIAFSGPGNTPGVLLRLSKDKVAAYSRICTHAGCIVGYDGAANLLVCPCHGAEFDPTRGAAVVAGPAPTPLRRIPVSVDPGTRKVYLTA